MFYPILKLPSPAFSSSYRSTITLNEVFLSIKYLFEKSCFGLFRNQLNLFKHTIKYISNICHDTVHVIALLKIVFLTYAFKTVFLYYLSSWSFLSLFF